MGNSCSEGVQKENTERMTQQGEEHTLPQCTEPEQKRTSGNTISPELAAEVFSASSGALLSLMLQRVIEMPASYEPGANFPWDLIKLLNTATLDNVYAVSREWQSAFRLIMRNWKKMIVSPWIGCLEDASEEGGTYQTGPMPTILQVMKNNQLELSPHCSIKASADNHLSFNGREGAVLIPSLDATSLMKLNNIDLLTEVTVCISVNSNSYNRGLGAGVIAAVEMNGSDLELAKPSTYDHYNHRDNVLTGKGARSAVVKFHPGMRGGALRVEGPGGFSNLSVGGGIREKNWDCANVENSGGELHHLRITCRASGVNTISIAETGWSKNWTCKLFDGRYLPGVFVWIDLGGEQGKPLIVGEISYEMRT